MALWKNGCFRSSKWWPNQFEMLSKWPRIVTNYKVVKHWGLLNCRRYFSHIFGSKPWWCEWRSNLGLSLLLVPHHRLALFEAALVKMTTKVVNYPSNSISSLLRHPTQCRDINKIVNRRFDLQPYLWSRKYERNIFCNSVSPKHQCASPKLWLGTP